MSALLLSLLLLRAPESKLDGNEIMKVLEGLHAPIKDFEFVCEGETKWLADAGDMYREAPDIESGRFQGTYAYRRDGAAYWDVYLKPFDPHADFRHDTYTQLRESRSWIYRTPDRRGPSEAVRAEPGGLGSSGAAISPDRFNYLGYWCRLGYSTRVIEIESSDWDEIDGHRTLRLTINEFSKGRPATKVKVWSKYWIDLERGGHVLRHESYRGAHLISRTSNVRLSSIRLSSGQQVWLPTHGEFDTFWWLKGFSDSPLFHEAYDVVQGSIVLNSGLPDERFSLQWNGHKVDTTKLKQVRKDFESTPPKPAPPKLRTDPAGVEEYQKQRLAEAERQARELDASPSARRGWDTTVLFQGGLAIAGFGALVTSFLLRRRAG